MSFDEVYISEIIKAFFEHRNDRVSLIKIDKQRKKILLDIGEYEITQMEIECLENELSIFGYDYRIEVIE